jgi:CheY-specific phosphatase CheX
MSLVPQDEAPAPGPLPMRAAAIAFDGPFSGELVVRASAELLPHLAANMLGLDEPSAASADQQEDALKELANVICGNLLPALAGREPVFRVGVPRTLTADEPAPGQQPAAARLFLDVGRVELALSVNQPAAAGPAA